MQRRNHFRKKNQEFFLRPTCTVTHFFLIDCQMISIRNTSCVCYNPHSRQLHAFTRLETLRFLSQGNLCRYLAKPLPSSTLLCPRGLANEKPGWRLHAEGGTRVYYPHYPPCSTLSADF